MTRRLLFLFIVLIFTRTISIAQKQPLQDFGNSRNPVSAVLFANNNTQLIAGGFLKIWDIKNNSKPVFRAIDESMEYDNGRLRDADLSNGGNYIAALTGGRIEIYKISTGEITDKIKNPNITGLAFGPENILAYISRKGDLKTYNITTEQTVSLEDFKGIKPQHIDWSPSGKFIAIGGIGDNVIIYNYPERKVHKSPVIGIRNITDLTFSPDNAYLALSGKNGIVTVLETSTGIPVKKSAGTSEWNICTFFP